MEEEKLLTEERKITVLYELLSACVAGEVCDDGSKGYDARHRVALRLLATWLNVKWTKVEAMEIMVASSLMVPLKKEDSEEDEKSTTGGWKRGGRIGAAALTGGTLRALTGGLAAPAIAQGLGALAPTLGSIVPSVGAGGFAAAAGATGSIAGSVTVAASFGAAGAGLAGSKMAKRNGGLDEFGFKKTGKNHNQEIAANVMQGGAVLTVLSTLLAALTLPVALVTASDLIDSAWAIAVDRSDEAGKLLAEVLLKGLQGNRPVTLVGFSLGARVILKCLQCLAETKGDNAGLVERVVLLGAAVSINDEEWEDARKMLAGRFVNVYSSYDWTLGIIFRASILSTVVAGIQPVDLQGIENVDVTEVIEGHHSYFWMTKQILRQLDLDYYYPIFRTTQEEKSSKQT